LGKKESWIFDPLLIGNFTLREEMGSGSFGSVFRLTTNAGAGADVVVKWVRPTAKGKQKLATEFKNHEIAMIDSFGPVVYGYSYDDAYGGCLIMELFEESGDDYYDMITHTAASSWAPGAARATCMAENFGSLLNVRLLQLLGSRINCTDMKLGNILCNSDIHGVITKLVLTDFGDNACAPRATPETPLSTAMALGVLQCSIVAVRLMRMPAATRTAPLLFNKDLHHFHNYFNNVKEATVAGTMSPATLQAQLCQGIHNKVFTCSFYSALYYIKYATTGKPDLKAGFAPGTAEGIISAFLNTFYPTNIGNCAVAPPPPPLTQNPSLGMRRRDEGDISATLNRLHLSSVS
jgi:hypothetical protein